MHDTSAYIKPCLIDKNQAPCKSCGAFGVVYRYGPLYFAECSGGKCDTPHRHMHSTKREAIAEWNRLNKKEEPEE